MIDMSKLTYPKATRPTINTYGGTGSIGGDQAPDWTGKSGTYGGYGARTGQGAGTYGLGADDTVSLAKQVYAYYKQYGQYPNWGIEPDRLEKLMKLGQANSEDTGAGDQSTVGKPMYPDLWNWAEKGIKSQYNQTPETWAWAKDLLTGSDWGKPAYDVPGATDFGGISPTEMVDTKALYDAAKAVSDRYLSEKGADLAEQFGVGGIRYSTPLQTNLVRETQRQAENLANMQAQADIAAQESYQGRKLSAEEALRDRTLASQEAYKGRQMTAQEAAQSRLLEALGLGTGLGSAESERALSLLGMGGQLGQMEAQLPMDLAGLMSSLGGNLMNQQGAQLQGQQMNPWLQQALGWGGSASGVPQTYQPSGWTSMLGGLSSLLPYLLKYLNRGKETGGSDTWRS